MDLEEILAPKNAHIRSKEAEARHILMEWAGPVGETLERLKREFGAFLHLREMGRLISPTEEANYRVGKALSTRFLFDVYAEVAFAFVFETEIFIALLVPIREKVQQTLTVIDRHEADLRELDWQKRAWARQEELLDSAKMVSPTHPISAVRRAWQRIRAFWASDPPPVREVFTVEPSPDSEGGRVSRSDAAAAPLPTIGGAPRPMAAVPNGGPATDRSAMVDDFLLRCNQEPNLSKKIGRKHISIAAGHKRERQFQYWQACDPKATPSDDLAFGRILAMAPEEFVELLKKKKILDA